MLPVTPPPRRPPGAGRALLLGSSAAALALAAVTDQGPHRVWGLIAGAGYLLLGLSGFARRACAPWLAGLLGAGLPLAVLVAARATAGPGGGPDAHAQVEVRLVEDAARRWVQTGSPHPDAARTAALAASGHGVDGYFPYLPGMAVFGLPRALLGTVWFTDARVVFLLVTVACLVFAVHRLGLRGGRWVGWFAAGNPVVGLTVATGGHDLPMAGLLVAAFACCARPRDGADGRAAFAVAGPSGLAAAGGLAGLAMSTKPSAWPVAVVLLALVAATRGTRSAARVTACALVPVLACLPALLTAGPRVVLDQLVAFPAGLAAVPTPAGSPLPGGWLAAAPHGCAVALAVLAVTAALLAVRLWRAPPRDVDHAARFAALAMTAATLLAPSSRVGWLVLPILLLTVITPSRRHGRARRVSVGAWDCSAEEAAPVTPPHPPPSPPPPSSSPTSSGARS